jgi:hypothetical protein
MAAAKDFDKYKDQTSLRFSYCVFGCLMLNLKLKDHNLQVRHPIQIAVVTIRGKRERMNVCVSGESPLTE